MVRVQPDLLGALDNWIEVSDVGMTRPEAMRRLVEFALATKGGNP